MPAGNSHLAIELYHGQKKVDRAIASYVRAIELDPKYAIAHNNLAWLLATCQEVKFRDPARAVELATKAVELEPTSGQFWRTLGAAHNRAGNWQDAIAALNKSMALAGRRQHQLVLLVHELLETRQQRRSSKMVCQGCRVDGPDTSRTTSY